MENSEKTNRALVIGGTGFIGSNLVRYLREKGNEVVIYHRKSSDLKNLIGLSWKSVLGDLSDKETVETSLENAMEGCEVVYNLAVCGSSLKRYQHMRDVINIRAARTIAKVARRVGGLRLIHVSSSSAVGYPDNDKIADETYTFNAYYDPYAISKYRGEKEVLKEVRNGLDAVVAIPCSTVGAHGMKNDQFRTFMSIAKGKLKVFPPGGLCLTNVNDLVRGLVQCYEKGLCGKRYILGGCNITYKQYLGEIASASSGKAPNIRLPKTLLLLLGLMVEIFSVIVKQDTDISKIVAMMVTKNLFYTSELAQRELGYTITDWKETIRLAVSKLHDIEKIDKKAERFKKPSLATP
ncbi:MAG: NAD-dependent epimerase/dehydratase family protein [Candidatus Scalindua sp.]|nr:NAD-dependent epimerase/dehydratase family protein [Candidatus Scalindua sp.]